MPPHYHGSRINLNIGHYLIYTQSYTEIGMCSLAGRSSPLSAGRLPSSQHWKNHGRLFAGYHRSALMFRITSFCRAISIISAWPAQIKRVEECVAEALLPPLSLIWWPYALSWSAAARCGLYGGLSGKVARFFVQFGMSHGSPASRVFSARMGVVRFMEMNLTGARAEQFIARE